jgi:acylglycerol lipase
LFGFEPGLISDVLNGSLVLYWAYRLKGHTVVQHQTGSFTGSKDYKLYFQCWLPDKAVKAVVFLAHGISEHSGRYVGLGVFLASQGFAVYAFDYRHHGQSDGQKGQMDNFSLILDDFALFMAIIQKAQPGRKIFLFGHSMGASLSMGFAPTCQSSLAGLILSGSPLRSQPRIPTAVIGLLYPLVVITPHLGLYKLDSSTLSRDKVVVEGYDHDPLVFRSKLSCRLIISFMWCLHEVEAGLTETTIPVLILHGTHDNLCSPDGSRVVLQKIASKDKTYIPYQGYYHEILNEPQKDRVRQDILAWLNKRV